MQSCITLKKLGGFYNAYNKVVNRLEENSINYIIEGNTVEQKDFKNKNRYHFFVEKGKKMYEKECRANCLYERIENLKESEMDELLSLIENYVLER